MLQIFYVIFTHLASKTEKFDLNTQKPDRKKRKNDEGAPLIQRERLRACTTQRRLQLQLVVGIGELKQR